MIIIKVERNYTNTHLPPSPDTQNPGHHTFSSVLCFCFLLNVMPSLWEKSRHVLCRENLKTMSS